MIKKILNAIDNIQIAQDKLEIDLKKEDELTFKYFEYFDDPELVGHEQISNFDELLIVLSRPMHYKNLYWFTKVVEFLINQFNLNRLVNMDIKTKVILQEKLLSIPKLMKKVYAEKMNEKDAWWYDEHGLVKAGINLSIKLQI